MEWSGRAPFLLASKLARGTKDKARAMSEKFNAAIAVIGIDIGKNSFRRHAALNFDIADALSHNIADQREDAGSIAAVRRASVAVL
jgi:hypothetical protein